MPATMELEKKLERDESAWTISCAATFGCSRRGAVHAHRGVACQDAWALERVDGPPLDALVLAVADGHGASVHDLSEVGSKLAVRAAGIVSRQLIEELGGMEDLKPLTIACRIQFPKRVLSCWRQLVVADARERIPDTDFDAPDLTPLYQRYGSTLLVAVVTDEKVLISSIGDGDVVLVRPDGTIGMHLQQDAPELVGSMTFSLASYDAELFFQSVALERQEGGMILLCTDGMINSFVNSTYFLGFCVGLQDRIREWGFESVTSSIPTWLDYFSAHGSGDDITMLLGWVEANIPAGQSGKGEALASLSRKLVRPLGIRRAVRPARSLTHRFPAGTPTTGPRRSRRPTSSCIDCRGAAFPVGFFR